MGQKVIFSYFYVTLLIVTALLEFTCAGPKRKFEPNIRDHFTRQKYIVEKLSKSKRGEMSWFMQKRTTYTDPCPTVADDIDTKDRDETASESVKSSSMYFPEKLTEVSCQANSLNARQKPSCHGFNGDCIDITTTIKVFRISNGNFDTVSVSLKVGCACMIPI